MKSNTLFISLVLLVSFMTSSYAHGDLHERIVKMSEQIELHQDSASLYFERAKLYFYHEQFDLSITDLDSADQLGLDDPLKDLFYAKANQSLKNYTQTLQFTDKIIQADPINVNAIKIKAEVLFEQGNFLESAHAYERLLKTARRTLPENFLNAAKSWRQCSTPKDKDNAIDVLNRGMEELGTLPMFLKKKKDYYLEDKQYNKAYAVQIRIIENVQRKETALFQAAEIAMLKEDYVLAQSYIEKSEQAFYALPKRIQVNKAMQSLKTSILNTKTSLIHHL